tara:strand:- start:931 stop:2247 length:1317 start_codon:yes stop_codon:yes gene_type:complete
MPVSILMPALSPTMTEGNVAKWLKNVGDTVKAGDIIAEVETDKATMEVESIDEGKLAKIIHNDGSENIAVNSLIGVISLEGESDGDVEKFIQDQNINISKPIENIEEETKTNIIEDDTSNNLTAENKEENSKDNPELTVVKTKNNHNDINSVSISPLAKRIADLKEINVEHIKGSGPRGRIIKRDLDAFLNNDNKEVEENTENSKLNYIQKSSKTLLTNIRKTISTRLQNSKQTIPHFYLKTKINAQEIIKAKTLFNDVNFNHKNKISLNDIIIKAVASALKLVPEMNATWNKDSIINYSLADISIAVATDKGLFTPVIRSACSKSISQISEEMKMLITKARDSKLLPEDYTGGSFSISNLGMYNVNEFSAIINPPQSGILAVGEIFNEVKLDSEKVIEVKMINLVLSVDHRIADGAVAASFLKKLKLLLENPLGMLV